MCILYNMLFNLSQLQMFVCLSYVVYMYAYYLVVYNMCVYIYCFQFVFVVMVMGPSGWSRKVRLPRYWMKPWECPGLRWSVPRWLAVSRVLVHVCWFELFFSTLTSSLWSQGEILLFLWLSDAVACGLNVNISIVISNFQIWFGIATLSSFSVEHI